MAESNSEVELVSCVDGEEWFSNAQDLYQFHAGELRQHKQAILGQFDDDIDHKNIYDTVPDQGVIHALINADNTWKQRSPTVVAVLRNGQYLARVFNIDYRDATVEFIVLDCNKPGNIVHSFNWSLGAYWSNFGYGNRGGCCLTADLIKFLIRTSPHRDYVMIVGPSEDNIMPGVKLLHYTDNMWSVKNMNFENESEGLQRCWPVNIMFDPRPEYNGHVYLSLSTEKTWIYTRYVYRYDTRNLDAICKYDVHKDKPIVYRFPDKSISRNCFDLLNNGQYLILSQPSDGDSERLDVLIVDTENLETKVRITINQLGMVEGFDSMDRCLTVPFISLCRNYFAMLFWMKQWRATMPTWAVATFKVQGLLTHVLTLKQLARISILRSTKVSNTFCLPLPETLKDYLVN